MTINSSTINRVKNLIKENKLKESINSLENSFRIAGKKAPEILIVLGQRITSNKNRELEGTRSDEDLLVESNKIARSILSWLSILEAEHPFHKGLISLHHYNYNNAYLLFKTIKIVSPNYFNAQLNLCICQLAFTKNQDELIAVLQEMNSLEEKLISNLEEEYTLNIEQLLSYLLFNRGMIMKKMNQFEMQSADYKKLCILDSNLAFALK